MHLYESPLVKINEILTNQNNNRETFSGLKHFSLRENISIDNLNFKHNSKVIFDSLSLKIKAGKTTSIYAGSGKGKPP